MNVNKIGMQDELLKTENMQVHLLVILLFGIIGKFKFSLINHILTSIDDSISLAINPSNASN